MTGFSAVRDDFRDAALSSPGRLLAGSYPLKRKGRPEPPLHNQGFKSHECFPELRWSISMFHGNTEML
jgi:hypothetical protein